MSNYLDKDGLVRLWSNIKSYVNSRIPEEGDDLLKSYPVGAIYISYNATSPASLFGGTWTAITGRFPYFNAGTATGGSNTHTLTVAQMPSHNHTATTYYEPKKVASGTAGNYINAGGSSSSTAPVVISSTGGGGSHNNMPAYQSLYAWRRTA